MTSQLHQNIQAYTGSAWGWRHHGYTILELGQFSEHLWYQRWHLCVHGHGWSNHRVLWIKRAFPMGKSLLSFQRGYLSTIIWSKSFRAQFNQDPTPSFSIVKSAIKLNLIKELIKKLFSQHYLFSLPSFPFVLFLSLLIRVITFWNWYKKNALALHRSVRK